MTEKEKPILYVDMDGTLVDFNSGIEKLPQRIASKYDGRLDECPNIFSMMSPTPDAIESLYKLSEKFDLYILSTSPWNAPMALKDKLEWIGKYFGKDKDSLFYKKVIFSHNKHLNSGWGIIDDRIKNGVDKFKGIHFHFGTDKFPDWKTLTEYLLKLEI